MLGANAQVRAQFGADSNELQGLGLKKKSEYKKAKAANADRQGLLSAPPIDVR